ncbi:MAG: twin-arginine translocase TatA/TatE family subunit, partial [Nitrospiraceae bacterium]
AFLLFGPKQLPEIGRQVGKAVKGFKETADDLRKTVEPEINLIQQEVKMVEQDFEASVKEAEEEINTVTNQPGQGTEPTNKPGQA